MENISLQNLENELQEMREYFKSGKTKDYSWRHSQLKGLCLFIKEKETEIFKALKQDLGKHHVEAFRDEVGTLTKALNVALKGLKNWMSSQKAKLPKIAIMASAELVPEPLGLVLVISSCNFPFGISLEPLIGAIAAGNTAVLKPSELGPSSSSLLANSLPNYIDTNAIKVIQGGPSVGEHLLQQKWDKIFFTGNARVARTVMSAAVKHLTPVVLELGGKCPAILDSLSSSFDRKVTANRVTVSKFGACAGQACIAIDYVLVEKKFAPTLVALMKVAIKNMFGDSPRESNSITRIVNKQHFLRLKNLLIDSAVQNSIIHGGSMDEDNLSIEPTILLDPPLEAEIMTDEIFGPVLPIITYTADTLPFGGIGESGIGKYHGKFSFVVFTHYKSVLWRNFLVDFWFRFPPWNDHKLLLFETAYNLDYLGLLLAALGLKKPARKFHDIDNC